ncbi:MAG: ribosome small subunit-dependent GTPase A [Flavobacteriales bacterium]|nr:ribosome small subunit-dependent GTPase A [Flavobacteriales bacterium]
MRSTGSRYVVRDAQGGLHDCVARGNLRIRGFKSTNPIAVGDHVEFEPAGLAEGEERVGAVLEVRDRKNYLVRRSVNLSHQKHVIAANLDQAMLVVTVERPRTSFGFIDRFLVSAESYGISTVLVFNKTDDLDDQEGEALEQMIAVYRNAGYTCLRTAALAGVGVKEVEQLLMGKVTLLAGHSGVGKSTLMNAIDPKLDLHTAAVSRASEKGQHTTTYAEMFELNGRGRGRGPTFVIDTPGIKGLGLVDLDKAHIADQFPEMFVLRSSCRFSNCLHRNEPGCAVLNALSKGEVAESRYRSYVDMCDGLEEADTYRANDR